MWGWEGVLLQRDFASESPLSARQTILQIFDARPGALVSAAELARVAAVLDIAGPAVRVALRRLVAEGALISPERGLYAAGRRREALQRLWSDWRRVENRLAPWTGRWRVIFTDQVRKANSSAHRAHERALHVGGYSPVDEMAWARTDNLVIAHEDQIEELRDAGLDPSCGAALCELDAVATKRFVRACRPDDLTENYKRAAAELIEEERRLCDAPRAEAMRAAFHVGRGAIRMVVFDPLLPDKLIDTEARAAFFAAARSYVEKGYCAWRGEND